jgi:hypothetical protein
MASDENWALAQRFGRWACAIGGLSVVLFGALGMSVMAFAAILAMGGTCAVWSWTKTRHKVSSGPKNNQARRPTAIPVVFQHSDYGGKRRKKRVVTSGTGD